MRLHGIATRSILAVAGTTLMLTSSATAQQMDQAAYDRWAPVVVVHYVVVGDYAADTQVSEKAIGSSGARAAVKDRVEFTFDWDQSEMKLVGTPVVRNSPSTIEHVTAYGGCGTPRLTGTYEHATYLTATSDGLGNLNANVKRDWVAAVVDQMGDAGSPCGATTVSIPAKSETTPGMIIVAPPMYYAMPATAAVKLSADKKSVIMNTSDGWTWTYTMTPVR